jgi:hypothetical protein
MSSSIRPAYASGRRQRNLARFATDGQPPSRTLDEELMPHGTVFRSYGEIVRDHQARTTGLLLVLAGLLLAGLSWAALTRSTPVDSSLTEARSSLQLLRGVPEDGITLGSATAPATLVAYVDATYRSEMFEPSVLRALVKDYVRPGRLKIQVRTLSNDTGQDDSDGALAAENVLQAAGLQDRLWQLYAFLNARYTGVLDATDLTQAASLIPGLDAAAVVREARSPRVIAAVARSDAYAAASAVTDPPVFFVQKSVAGSTPARLSSRGPLLRHLAAAMADPFSG